LVVQLTELRGETEAWVVTPAIEDLPREVERFLTTIRAEEIEFDRYLATVLFTDIVGSTELAASAGDAAWRTLLERHHHIVRGALARYRGTEMDTAGDGFFATFDGPARAVRCAMAIGVGVRELGIDIRAGIHTGEMQTIDEKGGGIAVTIGSRIMATAGRSEVLVSQTVKDLVAGSGLLRRSRRARAERCPRPVASLPGRDLVRDVGFCATHIRGDDRTRTDDPLLAKQVLYQLSYVPADRVYRADTGSQRTDGLDPIAHADRAAPRDPGVHPSQTE
jgi:class 3 adenylate cyclase